MVGYLIPVALAHSFKTKTEESLSKIFKDRLLNTREISHNPQTNRSYYCGASGGVSGVSGASAGNKVLEISALLI